jgi:4'-phosphopantetheinyl transferase
LFIANSLFHSIFELMVYVFYHYIDEASDEEAIDNIFNSFPSTLQSQILKCKNKKDRNMTIIGRVLLVEALRVLKIDYGLDEIKFTQYRRPYFNDSFDFNISHSHDFVVCAVSKTNHVGIDVEKIKPVDLNDFKMGFRDKDWNNVLSADDRLKHFYSLWTKRESFLKAVGTGFIQLPAEVSYNANKIAWNKKEWSICQLLLHEEYCCHLVVDQSEPEIQLKEINSIELAGIFD